MLHFSCDLCGRSLADERYVVRVEVYPAFDPDQVTPADLDADHLADMAAVINELELHGGDQADDEETREYRFDLCDTCRSRYVRDPLGREMFRRLNFSKN